MACGMSYVKDIGLVATAKGWKLHFGCCATAKARSGVLLASSIARRGLAFIEIFLLCVIGVCPLNDPKFSI